MARAVVRVREARPADIPDLLALWGELRDQAPRRALRLGGGDPAMNAESRYVAAMGSPDCRLVVATIGEEIGGMALLCRTTASTVVDIPAIDMSHVCVARGHQSRGIGRALVAAAAAYAEECGVEQVVVGVFPQHREANRFYARLGFATLTVRRMAPVSTIHRRLGPADFRASLLAGQGRAALLRREIRMPRTLPRRRAHNTARVPADRTDV